MSPALQSSLMGLGRPSNARVNDAVKQPLGRGEQSMVLRS